MSRPHGTKKPPTYRCQVMLDEPTPRLSRIKRLEWIVGKLLAMIEKLKGK
jgi:hypothetical protein